MWVLPKIVVPQNRDGFIMEHPIKMDDLGVPLFSETSMYFMESIGVFVVVAQLSSIQVGFYAQMKVSLSLVFCWAWGKVKVELMNESLWCWCASFEYCFSCVGSFHFI